MWSPAQPAAAVFRAARGAGSPAPNRQHRVLRLDPVDSLADSHAPARRVPRRAAARWNRDLPERRGTPASRASRSRGDAHPPPRPPAAPSPGRRCDRSSSARAARRSAPPPAPRRGAAPRSRGRAPCVTPARPPAIGRARTTPAAAAPRPTRLRSAMIASQAALAADIVVVYGTPCCSAARRIA